MPKRVRLVVCLVFVGVVGIAVSASAPEEGGGIEGVAYAQPKKGPSAKAAPKPTAKPPASAAPSAAPSASSSASATATSTPSTALPPGARAPRSGSCDNSSNTCGGDGETCRDNKCFCKAGFARCGKEDDGTPKYHCTSTSDDEANCGACGKKCGAGQVCTDGKCGRCPAGQTNCDGSCVSLRDDESNCGKCGRECPSNFMCQSGSCRL